MKRFYNLNSIVERVKNGAAKKMKGKKIRIVFSL
jgi:hypothetical protein